jgi:hypothetical protein
MERGSPGLKKFSANSVTKYRGSLVCSLLNIFYSLLISVYSLLIIVYSLLISVYSLFILFYSLLIIIYSLLTIFYSLLIIIHPYCYSISFILIHFAGNFR